MMSRGLLVLFLLAAATSIADEPVVAEAAGPDSALVRTAIVVSDIERSKQFFVHTFGYEVGFEGDITRPAVIELLQLDEGQTVSFVTLRHPGAENVTELPAAMIGLMHVDNPPLPSLQRSGGHGLVTGEGILAIVTTDIGEVYARLAELEAEILRPPELSANGRETELVVRDPDGLRIHVVEVHNDANN